MSIASLGAACALVCSALAVGCVEVERVPVRSARASTATGITSEPLPGVSNAQQAPPADEDIVAAPEPPAVAAPDRSSATEPPPDSQAVAVPASSSAIDPPPDIRTRAAQIVELAAQQIYRLRRMESSGNDSAPREDMDFASSNLENKRELVLQDLREFELRPSKSGLARLDGDAAYLQGAVRASYVIAPPPSQGLPGPTPLPPSEAW
jgi:hypothetical protein